MIWDESIGNVGLYNLHWDFLHLYYKCRTKCQDLFWLGSASLTIRCLSSSSLVFDFWRQWPYFHFPFFFQDAKVMSWWDYGYQITAMANRTILVDNNTWNNTHISRVGQVKWRNHLSSWHIGFYWGIFLSEGYDLEFCSEKCAFIFLGNGVHRRKSLWDHEGAWC